MKIFPIKSTFFGLIRRSNVFNQEFALFNFILKYSFFILNYGKVYRVSVLVVYVGICLLRSLFGQFIFLHVRGTSRKIQTGIFISFNNTAIFLYTYLHLFKRKQLYHSMGQFYQDQNTYMGDEIMRKVKSYTQNLITFIFFFLHITVFMLVIVGLLSTESDETVIMSEKWLYKVPTLNTLEIEYCQRSFGELCRHVESFQRSSIYKIIILVSTNMTSSAYCQMIISHVIVSASLRARVSIFREHLKYMDKNYHINRSREILLYDTCVDKHFRKLYMELQEIQK